MFVKLILVCGCPVAEAEGGGTAADKGVSSEVSSFAESDNWIAPFARRSSKASRMPSASAQGSFSLSALALAIPRAHSSAAHDRLFEQRVGDNTANYVGVGDCFARRREGPMCSEVPVRSWAVAWPSWFK